MKMMMFVNLRVLFKHCDYVDLKKKMAHDSVYWVIKISSGRFEKRFPKP